MTRRPSAMTIRERLLIRRGDLMPECRDRRVGQEPPEASCLVYIPPSPSTLLGTTSWSHDVFRNGCRIVSLLSVSFSSSSFSMYYFWFICIA